MLSAGFVSAAAVGCSVFAGESKMDFKSDFFPRLCRASNATWSQRSPSPRCMSYCWRRCPRQTFDTCIRDVSYVWSEWSASGNSTYKKKKNTFTLSAATVMTIVTQADEMRMVFFKFCELWWGLKISWGLFLFGLRPGCCSPSRSAAVSLHAVLHILGLAKYLCPPVDSCLFQTIVN